MSANLKNQYKEYMEDSLNDISYETLTDLAVLYASRMDVASKKVFFKQMKGKFLKELPYLND
jgi:predicted metal-dependent hydrolase